MHSLLEKLVPPADQPVAGWHVSPAVDLVAYQFSWLWILVPLALAGDAHPKDYLLLWAVGMTLSFVHRQYTMPYVYLDQQIFSQHLTRFTLFMGLILLGSVASVFVFRWKGPAGFFVPLDAALFVAGGVLLAQCVVADKREHRFSVPVLAAIAAPFVLIVALGLVGVLMAHHLTVASVVIVGFALSSIVAAREVHTSSSAQARASAALFPIVIVALLICGLLSLVFVSAPLHAGTVRGRSIIGLIGAFATLWNVWHTLMQKFGILRLYAAKSAVALDRRTPAWVDRLLVFGSFPFLAAWLGPAQRETIGKFAKSVTGYLMPVIDVLDVVQPVLLPVAAAFAVCSIACFLWFEHRADRLRCGPRLSMALALTLLNLSFLLFSPLKVYIAYGFSHAIEYMVFVWAFLRRRYAQPLPHRPLIQRLLTRPLLAYALFTLSIAGVFFFIEFGNSYGLYEGRMKFFDVKVGQWLFSFAIWHSMAHFYYDGFLWKMRAQSVRASL
jgi:hypothetical protein